MLGNGISGSGLELAEQYRQMLMEEPMQVLTEEDFTEEARRSHQAQQELEAADSLSFTAFLASKKG